MPLNLHEEWSLPEGRFVLTKHLSGGFLLFKHLSTDRDTILGRGEFDDLHASGRAKRIRSARGRAGCYEEQDEVPPEGADDRALARRFYCRKWDEAPSGLGDVGLRRLVAFHAPEAARRGIAWRPSPGALRRALSSRGEVGRRPLRVMQSLTGKTRRARWPVVVEEAMRRCVLWYYAHRPRTSGDAHNRLVHILTRLNGFGRHRLGPAWRLIKTPHAETLRLRIIAEERFETAAAKYGEVEARRRFKGTVSALKADAVLDYVLIDSTVVDGWCVIDNHDGMLVPAGRPTLTAAIDLYSRTILGIVLTYEPPSLYTIMSCVQAITTKKVALLEDHPEFATLWEDKWGKPDTILVDNEWAQVGVSFQDACEDAGISVEWAPVKNPEYKAYIERFFGTLNTKLFHRMPGGVPFNPSLMRKLGLDPAKDAVVGRADLEALIHRTLRDTYQFEPHAGTGLPPETLWRKGIAEGREYIDDARFLAAAFGTVGVATLTRSGIVFKDMRFHDPLVTSELLNDLARTTPVRQRRKGSATAKVKIKYNPADISKIEVWNPKATPRKRYVTLPNEDEAYAKGGLGFWHHKMFKTYAEHEALTFSTPAERAIVKDRLRADLESAAPKMKMDAMRKYRRMKDKAKPVLTGEVVEQILIPASVQGMNRSDIPVVIAAEERVGDGMPGKGPRRGGAKATRKANQTRAGKAAKPDHPASVIPRLVVATVDPVDDTAAYYEQLQREMDAANQS